MSRDGGETLIELLLSVAIMGVAVSAILGMLMMSSSASHLYGSTTKARDVLNSWAERLDQGEYATCATAGTAVVAPEASGWTYEAPNWTRTVDGYQYIATVEDVEFWTTNPAARWTNACSQDPGLQRWSLRVTVPGLGFPDVVDTLHLVKRNGCASTSSPGCSA